MPFPWVGKIPWIETRSPALQVDSLPADPQRSPKILEWLAYLFSSGFFQPRNRARVSCIAGRFFTTRESPRNTGEGSLCLLQGIFLTQESNQGLLHCGRILHQMSYQGSPGGKHHFHFLDDKLEHVFWSRKVLVG